MEGSVKSLIEAEQRAKDIVATAEKMKDSQKKEAKSMADQILNKQKQEHQRLYELEQEKVRFQPFLEAYW